MSLTSELRIDVLDSFSHLQLCLRQLSQAIIAEEGLPAWMHEPSQLLVCNRINDSHRALAVASINQLDYAPEQLPREILVSPGFIGASPKTLELAKQVNDAKDFFKQAVLKLRQAKLGLQDVDAYAKEAKIRIRSNQLSHALQKMGLAKLHLKQCYRKMPILKHPPLKLSWTWAHTRSIKRVSVEQAKHLLEKKSRDHGIEEQLTKLSQLPMGEPLAIVQELAPHLRANVLFANDVGTKPRQMVKGPTPIFFPASMATNTPDFKAPKQKMDKDESRLIRNDVRLEPKPFLPAIRAHRYRELS